MWRDLVNDAHSRGVVVSSDDVPQLMKARKKVELELKRQAGLRNPASNLFYGNPWGEVSLAACTKLL